MSLGKATTAKAARRSRAGGRRRNKRKTGLAQAVRAIVSRDSETKYRGQEPAYNPVIGTSYLGLWTPFSSAITDVREICYALPSVTSGTANWQRIGNQITPTRLSLHLEFCPTFPDTLRSVDKTVHVYVMTCKAVKSLANFSAIPITQMLSTGAGTNTSFDGTTRQAMFPVNKDEFTVLHHKTFRLCKGYGNINDAATVTSAGDTDAVITPSKSYHRLTMNIRTPAKLLYDNNSSLHPTNFAPFFVIGYTNNEADDNAPNAVDLQVIGFSQLYYKDE